MKLFEDIPAQSIPRLFKYIPLESEISVERAEKIVRGQEVWFSSLAQFNDPQECWFCIDFDSTESQIKALYAEMLRQQLHLDDATIREKADQMLTNNSLQAHLHVIARQSIRKHIEHSQAMLCLGTSEANYLMWSHYADGHRGICVELSLGEFGEWRKCTRPVHYSKSMPRFNWFTTPENEQWIATLLTKSDCWSYEQEWRVVDVWNGPGLRQLEPNMVRSVTLGARIDAANEDLVRRWAADSGIALRGALFQAADYGLLIVDDPPHQNAGEPAA